MAVLFNPNGRQIDHCGQIVFTRLGQKMNRYKRVVGVDVCKERLDIADSTNAIPMAVDYSIDEIKSKIVSKIKDPKNTLVVCEATGGLEYDLVELFTMPRSMSVLPTQRTRLRKRSWLF